MQGVRSKLSRLSNIASIVAISSVDDLEDYELLLSPTEPVTSGATARKLSQSEAIRLLKVSAVQQPTHMYQRARSVQYGHYIEHRTNLALELLAALRCAVPPHLRYAVLWVLLHCIAETSRLSGV